MLAALMAYKGVLIPAIAAIVAWYHGRYARSVADGQAQVAIAEQKADQTGDVTDLDQLP
jgi:hypothetical protein